MAKYRMDIFKPGRKRGHPVSLLWRRRDIYATNNADASAEAENLYRAYASQRTLTSFYLCDHAGRSVYASERGREAEREPLAAATSTR